MKTNETFFCAGAMKKGKKEKGKRINMRKYLLS